MYPRSYLRAARSVAPLSPTVPDAYLRRQDSRWNRLHSCSAHYGLHKSDTHYNKPFTAVPSNSRYELTKAQWSNLKGFTSLHPSILAFWASFLVYRCPLEFPS